MRQAQVRRRFAAALGGLLLLGGCASAAAQACKTHELGGFSMCVPPDWRLSQGGVDSVAGRFTADGLRLSFDYGPHADPLWPAPEGADSASVSPLAVDGRPARRVRYVVRSASAAGVHHLGLHVPDVRSSPLGSLKLTMLASAADPEQLTRAAWAMMSVRFNR